MPLGFAPFHQPSFCFVGLAIFYALVQKKSSRQAILQGFFFGLGFFGLGVSWVFVSIHEYGHLNEFVSGIVTLLFIIYLAIYPALTAGLYAKLAPERSTMLPISFSTLLFSGLWCFGEFLRATFMGGFPWLLLGFGQMDTPLRFLLPLLGVYGVSFFVCWASTSLALVFIAYKNRYTWAVVFVVLVLFPALWQETQWSQVSNKPIPVGVIQANLSMRDKWDEEFFWHLLQSYKTSLDALIIKNKLIVMPESAIPLPEDYVSDYLNEIHEQAKRIGSSVLLGIPQLTPFNDERYYNTMMTLGHAQGSYLKQHLVPFGEFIPSPFQSLFERFALPMANMQPGKTHQDLIQIQNHPVATLICYELAYPELLRAQLPLAEWIVSISDDGWFGHSFAIYQHLQMAQALSLQMARYQIVANNDGLSSIINTQGTLTATLPAFSPGLLEADIYPAQGSTPWVQWGDAPMQLLVLGLILWGLFLKPRSKRRKKSAA